MVYRRRRFSAIGLRRQTHFGQLDESQGLAKSFGPRASKVAPLTFLQVAPFLLPDHDDRLAVETRQATDNGSIFLAKPLEARLFGRPPDLSDFLPLVGNLRLSLLALLGAWVLAALGEELVWRGLLLDRVAGLFGNTRASWALSALIVSAAFGCAHANQGISGIVQEGLSGLLLTALYLACDRKLSVPIVAHGVTDTVDILLIFAGWYPGLR